MNYKDYPKNWHAVSRAIRSERAAGQCECAGECGQTHDVGRCAARHNWRAVYAGRRLLGYVQATHAPSEATRLARVVLTVAHLWRGPCWECQQRGVLCAIPEHLAAMCQRCHLRYDIPQHADTSRERRARRAGQIYLPGIEPLHAFLILTAKGQTQ